MQTNIVYESEIARRCQQSWPAVAKAISRKQRIKRAIIKVWPRLPEIFHGNMLALNVMGESHIHDVYYDTIFRYMRELKDNGDLSYEVVCKQNSKYKKS
jgi:hypothetical protein